VKNFLNIGRLGMCLAIPAKIIELLPENRAKVAIGGITKEIATDLIEKLQIGDYVIIHVGYALTKLNEEEAKKTLSIMQQIETLK
jgi:hydrogenase expression/formation protein HypC